MLQLTRNYTQIVEKDGVSFLFDAQAFYAISLRVDTIKPIYDEIRTTLKNYNYPDSEEWVRAVATGGADALVELLLRDNDREAKRLKVPAYIAIQWRKSVIQDAPQEMFDKANALRAKLLSLMDDNWFAIQDDDVKFQNGKIIVNADAIKERIKPMTMAPVSEQMRKEAQELRAIVPKLRELQEGGLHALDVAKTLMGNWLSPSKYPDLNDDVAIFSLLTRNRHNSREQIKAQSPEWYWLNGGE